MAKPPERPEPPPPRTNSLLIGHAAAEERLARWLAEDRLPHALMLCGPWGIGKATLAFRLARTLLRQTGQMAPAAIDGYGMVGRGEGDLGETKRHRLADDPNLVDTTARWVATGAHPDLLTIERRFDERKGRAQSEITVDDVRRLGVFFSSSPAVSAWRVAIIDAADEMNRHAANALLKVLEEPNARCVIVLVAHQPGLLAPTIRSRCRQLLLRPLADESLALLLARFLPGAADDDKARLSVMGEGSIGRIMQLAKEDGVGAHRCLQRYFERVASGGGDALSAVNDVVALAADEGGFQVTAHVLFWWMRRITQACLPGAAGQAASAGADGPADVATVHQIATAATLDRWLKVWDKTQRLAVQASAGNLDRKQVMVTALLDMQRELHPSAS